MSKIIYILLSLFLFFPFLAFIIKPSNAQFNGCREVKNFKIFTASSAEPVKEVYTNEAIKIEVEFSSYVNEDWNYYIFISDKGVVKADDHASNPAQKVIRTNPTVNFNIPEGVGRISNYHIELGRTTSSFPPTEKVCDLGTLKAFSKDFAQLKENNCTITMPEKVEFSTPFNITSNIPSIPSLTYTLFIFPRNEAARIELGRVINSGDVVPLVGSAVFSQPIKPPTTTISHTKILNRGDYSALIMAGKNADRYFCTVKKFSILNEETSEPTTSTTANPPGESLKKGEATEPLGPQTTSAGIKCDPDTGQIYKTGEDGADAAKGIRTAIGCISTDPADFVRSILRFALGIGGGIAFLLMVFGSFQMITSAGNPDSLKAGQERFRDAIIGLLFIIFAVLLLKIVGVDILGFGKFFGGP